MTLRAKLLACLFLLNAAGPALADDCGQDAFSAVVTEARGQLEALNARNTEIFQEKLAALKQREGWSDEETAAKARPLVQDLIIADFDARHRELLAQVPKIGQQARPVASLAGLTPAPQLSVDQHCAMLEELRGLMSHVVENAQAKWSYMLGKTDVAMSASAKAE